VEWLSDQDGRDFPCLWSRTLTDRANDDPRPLSPEARRALEEAAARKAAEVATAMPREIAGRGGLEPVRFGDWEIKGIASDF
jgi:hypothetical protein